MKHIPRKVIVCVIVLIVAAYAWSQDMIVTTDAKKIDAKILEVSRYGIKYKEFDNLDGPVFILETSNISSIIYSNGKVTIYDRVEPTKETDVDSDIQPLDTVASQSLSVDVQYDTIRDWHGIVDKIYIAHAVDIREYDVLYLYPIDESKVLWPDEDDNRYPALTRALKVFPDIIKEELRDEFKHLNVVFVDDMFVPEPNAKALLLRLRFNELNMGSRAERFWVGFGAGAQCITISGDVTDAKDYKYFAFKHRRLTSRAKRYEKCLIEEFENFAEDIKDIFDEFSEEIEKANRKKHR